MDLASYGEFFLAVFRSASPLVIAAFAALFCERSGVIQIALEGFMLFGAFCAAGVALQTNSFLGLTAAAALGLLLGLFYAFLVVKLRLDQIVSGIVVNMIAWGGIPILCKAIFGSSAGTPTIPSPNRLPSFYPIFIAVGALILTQAVISRTRIGLWITFAGDKPEALQSVGVSPRVVRMVSVCLGGVLAAVAGGCLSVALSSNYTRNMTAGRGFMALAALILGKWKPLPVFCSCLLFGLFDVLQMRLQGYQLPYIGLIPNQLIQMIPYATTLFILVGVVGNNSGPVQLGKAI